MKKNSHQLIQILAIGILLLNGINSAAAKSANIKNRYFKQQCDNSNCSKVCPPEYNGVCPPEYDLKSRVVYGDYQTFETDIQRTAKVIWQRGETFIVISGFDVPVQAKLHRNKYGELAFSWDSKACRECEYKGCSVLMRLSGHVYPQQKERTKDGKKFYYFVPRIYINEIRFNGYRDDMTKTETKWNLLKPSELEI